MTAAAIAAVSLAVLALIAWLVKGRLDASKEVAAANTRADAAILERDSARIRSAELAATVHSLTAELAQTRADLAALEAKEADHAADAVRAAADPIAEFNRVFKEAHMSFDAPAAPGRDGGAAEAVRPAKGPGAARAGG